MDGSVIFLSVTSQVYLPSDSCRSADFQLSLTSLSELSQHSLLVREKILRDNIQPSDIATLVTETLKAGKYSTQLVPGQSGDWASRADVWPPEISSLAAVSDWVTSSHQTSHSVTLLAQSLSDQARQGQGNYLHQTYTLLIYDKIWRVQL